MVYPENVNWPVEHTTYTAAAVILLADALSDSTPGADIMRGNTLVDHFDELALECRCGSTDPVVDPVVDRVVDPVVESVSGVS